MKITLNSLLTKKAYTSEFAQKFLQKLTANDNNIIRQIFDKEKLEQTSQASKRLQANYVLLSIPEVQNTIIEIIA